VGTTFTFIDTITTSSCGSCFSEVWEDPNAGSLTPLSIRACGDNELWHLRSVTQLLYQEVCLICYWNLFESVFQILGHEEGPNHERSTDGIWFICCSLWI